MFDPGAERDSPFVMSMSRSSIRRGVAALSLGAVLVGACTSNSPESSSPSEGSRDSSPPTTQAEGDESVPTSEAPSATDVATTETMTPIDDEPTASEPVDTEPVDTSPLTVDDVCETLSIGGFESRVDAVARFIAANDDGRANIETACGDDLTRLHDARAIRSAANALDERDDPIEITGLRCSNGDYSFIAENTSAVAVGVHVAFSIFADDDDDPTSSANYPIVIWMLEPGGKQGITGDFDEPDADTYRCNLSARVFVADTSAAGAGLPGVVDPGRTGDDPTEWIGALLEAETLAIGSGDIDAAASTEDLRSVFYDDVFDSTQSTEPATRIPSSIRICSATVDQPGPDRMSFVYYITYADGDATESFFRHGLFRRGADGQWRWLSAAHYFQSADFADCAV